MSAQAMELKQKILVVNDEPSIRKYLQTVLEVDGFAVETVSNGREAITKIANGERPDFIILDVLMPEMNGLDTLQELMRLERSLNVIMISCSTEFGTIAEAIRLGARDYLVIPFEKVELYGAMLRTKQRKQDQFLGVQRQIWRLSMKKQAQFWVTSNL
jgi:DNA-binding NtrC family response regulator